MKIKPVPLTSSNNTESDGMKRFLCKICHTTSGSDQGLIDHMVCHDVKQDAISQIIEDLLCTVCDKLFVSEEGITKHMSNQHTANATGMGNHEYSKQTGLLNVDCRVSLVL